MNIQIEQLVKLQALEVERTHLDKALHALPAEIVQANRELAAAEEQAARTRKSIAEEETLRARLDKEIADHRQKASRYRTQLDSVTTPSQAEAMEKEIRFSDDEAVRIENEEFTSLERGEALEASLQEAQAAIELKTMALGKIRTRCAQRQKEYTTQIAALDTERKTLRPLIDEALLQRFDHLAASRGTGLAKAENQLCTSCSMSIRPQLWSQLREGELLTCDSCGRMLYWDPDMRPLVK